MDKLETLHSFLQKDKKKRLNSLLFNVDSPHTNMLFNPRMIHLYEPSLKPVRFTNIHQYLQMLNIVITKP